MHNAFITLAIIPLLCSCGSNPITGSDEPLTAAKECAKNDGARYEVDGHLYTTLSVAKAAGHDELRQLTLAYYSQYPDIDPEYSAVPTAIKYFFVPWKWGWRKDINGVLHSLHGGGSGDVSDRRVTIANTLRETIKDPEKDWLSGLIIHAYGDSFAHTKSVYNSDSESAYGYVFGHALPSLFGTSPDDLSIKENIPKYNGFVAGLFKSLETEYSREDKLNEFLNSQICGDSSSCLSFHGPLDLSNRKGELLVEHFVGCMNKGARQLTSSEVQLAIDTLKK